MSIILTVQPYDDIQNYLDIVESNGGGILNLNPTDTFYPTSDIVIPTNTVFNGNGATIDFDGEDFGVKMIGTALDYITNSSLMNVSIINSNTVGFETDYTDNPIYNLYDNVSIYDCTKGVSVSNAIAPVFIGTIADNGSNIEIYDTTSIEFRFLGVSGSTTGNNVTFDTCTSSTLFDSSFTDATGHGIIMTDCDDISFLSVSILGSGGDGVRLVSGNTNVTTNVVSSRSNTGYGVNILDATTEDTIILGCNIKDNTAGQVSDSGTGTLIRSNIGVIDN